MGSLKKRRKAKIAKHKRRKRMKQSRHKKRLRSKKKRGLSAVAAGACRPHSRVRSRDACLYNRTLACQAVASAKASLRRIPPKGRIGSMRDQGKCEISVRRGGLFSLVFLAAASAAIAKAPRTSPPQIQSAPAGIKIERQDDSFSLKPAPDLVLRPEGERKAGALAHFVEGMVFEENGEMDKALEAYRKVLNVDPGQSALASRVAFLLIQQEDFPQAIDVLKDAIKANPNDAEPYHQLAFIYAKYLKKTDQAVDYANRAIALN